MTNVQAMFYQVRETDEDKDFLGFLWRPDADVTRDIIELRMTVRLFGAVSSPNCVCFSPRKTSEDNQHSRAGRYTGSYRIPVFIFLTILIF